MARNVMTTKIMKWQKRMVNALASCTIVLTPLAFAEEVDFSCMKESVKTKTQVSHKYREYDIVLENQCSESVYWSMCIERINPWTNKITETLTPSARVEKDKKFRINLQMKIQEEESIESYEKFYVSHEYGLISPPMVECMAYQCETRKRELREEMRRNDESLRKVRAAMAEQSKTDCTRLGWSDGEKERCRASVAMEYRPQLSELGVTQISIKERLAAVDPENCQIHPAD